MIVEKKVVFTSYFCPYYVMQFPHMVFCNDSYKLAIVLAESPNFGQADVLYMQILLISQASMLHQDLDLKKSNKLIFKIVVVVTVVAAFKILISFNVQCYISRYVPYSAVLSSLFACMFHIQSLNQSTLASNFFKKPTKAIVFSFFQINSYRTFFSVPHFFITPPYQCHSLCPRLYTCFTWRINDMIQNQSKFE